MPYLHLHKIIQGSHSSHKVTPNFSKFLKILNNMTRDRLTEFRQKAHISPEGEGRGDIGHSTSGGQSNKASPEHSSLPMEEVQSLQRLHGIDKFFEQVDDLRKQIQILTNDVRNVNKHHVDILSTPIPDEKKKQELDALMSTIKMRSGVIRTKLKDMEKIVKQEEKAVEKGETPASLRIRKIQHSSLLREFIDVMNAYQKDQVDYRDRCKARIKRQLHITQANLSDDQIEHIIEEGNFSIFTHGILIGQGKQRLEDCKARYNDIVKLEKSLKELHSLFMEVAVLIENQGDIVDRIETQVLLAKDYTGKATSHLREAEKFQIKAKKKKLWIMVILTLIFVGIGLTVYFTIT